MNNVAATPGAGRLSAAWYVRETIIAREGQIDGKRELRGGGGGHGGFLFEGKGGGGATSGCFSLFPAVRNGGVLVYMKHSTHLVGGFVFLFLCFSFLVFLFFSFIRRAPPRNSMRYIYPPKYSTLFSLVGS